MGEKEKIAMNETDSERIPQLAGVVSDYDNNNSLR